MSLSFLFEILSQMKPTTCSLDFIPIKFLRGFYSVGPFILSIINGYLAEGIFPSAFKHTVVPPLLNKPNLDPPDFSNLRLISKLPFLSNVLERVVHSFYILYQMKTSYRILNLVLAVDSTEMDYLKFTNDLLLAEDQWRAQFKFF